MCAHASVNSLPVSLLLRRSSTAVQERDLLHVISALTGHSNVTVPIPLQMCVFSLPQGGWGGLAGKGHIKTGTTLHSPFLRLLSMSSKVIPRQTHQITKPPLFIPGAGMHVLPSPRDTQAASNTTMRPTITMLCHVQLTSYNHTCQHNYLRTH